MNYKVNIEKIKENFNSFNEQKDSIDRQLLESLIENNEIFQAEGDDSQTKFMKSLAYTIANYQEQEIEIHVPNYVSENKIDWVKSGLLSLYAAIYLDKSSVIVNFTGNENNIEELFNVNLSKPDNLKVKLEEPEIIDWVLVPELIAVDWSDPEVVSNHIFYASNSIINNIKEALNLAPEELWEDQNFIKKIFEHKYLKGKSSTDLSNTLRSNFPEEFFYKKGTVELMMENLNYVSIFWNAHFKDKKNLFALEVSPDIISQVPDYKLEVYKSIQDNIFTDVRKVCYLIAYGNSSEIYDMTNQNVRYHADMLDFIYNDQNRLGINKKGNFYIVPHLLLEKEQNLIDDYQWMKNFLINHVDGFQLQTIPKSEEGMFNLQKNQFRKVFVSFIDDKEKILELCDLINKESFSFTYRILSEQLKNDKDIVKSFMNLSIHVYRDLPQEYKKEYLIQYINALPDELLKPIRMVSHEEILQIEDREVLKSIVKRGKYHWLKSKDCPEKWQEDLELLLLIEKPTDLISTGDEKIFYTLMQDAATLTKILREKPDLYKKLPVELQKEEEIIDLVLARNGDLPKAYYANKAFCIKALCLNPNHYKNIPHGFWKEKNFVLEICEKIDSGQIGKIIINKMPPEINQIFSAFKIEQDYSKFLSNYLLRIELDKKIENKTKYNNKKKL